MLSSSLEHGVPEQMFSTPTQPAQGVSAVKALQIAASQGQRIYHITKTNQADVLPKLRLDGLAITEITQGLASGREVIAHTDRINVSGWTGEGYIIYDPYTGSGAYKITGGSNGGYYTLVAYAGAMIFFLAQFINVLSKAHWLGLGPYVYAGVGPYFLLAIAVVTFVALILAVIYGPSFAEYQAEMKIIDKYVMASLIGVGLGILILSGLGPVLAMLYMIMLLSQQLMLLLVQIEPPLSPTLGTPRCRIQPSVEA